MDQSLANTRTQLHGRVCPAKEKMIVTRLPPLNEHVMKSNDEGPRQGEILDWLGQLLASPALRDARSDEDPRQSDVLDWLDHLVSAPPLDDVK
jgi:hypothetical protein